VSTQQTSATISYLFINPVVAAMAGDEYPSLLRQVGALGYRALDCPTAAASVHTAHETALRGASVRPLIDQRCPLIRQIVLQDYPALAGQLVVTPSILLTCARELHEQYVAANPVAGLTVITPCQALSAAGDELGLPRLTFLTWTRFAQQHALPNWLKRIDDSPIPPGFFQFKELTVLETSGESAVRNALDQTANQTCPADFLELLYCERGCHNGDGVWQSQLE
jgi:hypothetical protein